MIYYFNANKIQFIKHILDIVAMKPSYRHFSVGENPLEDFDSEMFRGGISYIRDVIYKIKKS